MLQRLFRQEVIDAQRGQWLGSIIVAAPLSRWFLNALALVLAAMILLILFLGHYTRHEAVSGQLVPSSGLLNITAQNAGTISLLQVHEGELVKAGDVLLRVSSDLDSAALGNTHTLVEQQLVAQRARLQSDLLNQRELSKQHADGLTAQITLARSQLTEIHGQLAIQQLLIASNRQLLDRVEPLVAKGYVSGMQVQQQRTTLLNAQAQYKVLVRQQLDAQRQLETVQKQIATQPLEDTSKQNEIERQISAVAQAMAQNEMRRALVLRAPADGIVSAVLTSEGQMVSAGQPLMSILPSGSTLVAQLLVPSRAIGFVEPDSRVILRYQAFPYQKFGQQYGRVEEISRSALSNTEVSALMGQASQLPEPMYRILVRLDSQHVLAYGKEEPMRSGMAVDADILMDRRRLIEWAFEPLFGMANRFGKGASHG